MTDIYELIKKEGFELIDEGTEHEKMRAFGNIYAITHPLNIHLRLYRDSRNPETKFFHMKAAHDYLWPEDIIAWHYWTERRFIAHCEGKNYITFAGGANIGKSVDAAKIALLFWLANPTKRTVIVASTTLASLESRIWGFVKRYLVKAKKRIPGLPGEYSSQPPPKILVVSRTKAENMKDSIHGMFAIAAKKGDDDQAISGWIGRHPEDSLLLILDEATDMPLAILKALPNLEAKPDKFQLIGIGNSLSKYDLHGSLSTPKAGWNSVDPMRDNRWDTTQRNGVCLFFSCYESPAIFETDPEKKKVLSRFLPTQDEIDKKEKEMGKGSDSFWRFVLGFWRTGTGVEVVIDPDYIERYGVMRLAEWSGVYPLKLVIGIDPSFSTGGDICVIRGAYLGVDTRGKMVLDFRGDKLLRYVPIEANTSKSVELQIVDGILAVVTEWGARLSDICLDANGQGKLLAETLRLRANSFDLPLRLVTGRFGQQADKLKQDRIMVKAAYDLWLDFKPFIEREQIRGLDPTTVIQVTHRLVTVDDNTGKVKLEPKSQYKKRMGNIMKSMARSPDEADAAAHTLQSAIINHGFFAGQEVQIENPFMVEKMYYQQKAVLEAQGHGPTQEEAGRVPELKSGLNSTLEDQVGRQKFFGFP